MRRLALAFLTLLSSGCATNLAILERANTMEPGQVRVAGQVGVHVPISTISRAASAGRAVSAGSEDSQAEAIAAGASLLMIPPGAVAGLTMRVGVIDDLDLGGRLSTSDWRGDVRYRFLKGKDGRATSALLGFEYHRFGGIAGLLEKTDILDQYIPGLSIEAPTRWDIDLAVIRGMNNAPFFKTYWAGRYRVAHYDLPSELSIGNVVERESLDGWMHMPGLSGGLAFGYKRFWFHLELNGVWAFSKVTVLGQESNIGGPIVFPALGMAIDTPPQWLGGKNKKKSEDKKGGKRRRGGG